MRSLRIGIAGAGRMGRIRALSASAHPYCKVTQVADSIPERASALASDLGAQWTTNWTKLVEASDVDVVVVATTHRYLTAISIAALQAGKDVFCEKPMARHFAEAQEMLVALETVQASCSRALSPTVTIGYTLRHHPAVQRAWQIAVSGEIGELFYVRGRYGHGGRAGYGDEWRTSPNESGGGQLLDQGVHLIDLSRCFLGNFTSTKGSTKCFHWAKNRSAVEDNAFMVLETAEEKVAFLHASWTQWKNIFSFEVFGEGGAVLVEGLGGNYGAETLQVMKRSLAGGAPEIRKFDFPARQLNGLDEVWVLEWNAFVKAVECKNESDRSSLLPATTEDGCAVLSTVHSLYQSCGSERLWATAI